MEGDGKRVLIIDDDEGILYLAGIALMDRGYNVHSASDGCRGAEHMKKRRYDVVLVDMPRLNGLQFIETCRVMWPETPIILLMSGDDFVIDRSNLVKGIIGCIAKPFESFRLIELVNQACCSLPQSGAFKLSCDGRKRDPRPSRSKGHDTGLHATRAVPRTN